MQHILTNLIVEPDGEEATGRANLLVSFAKTGPDEPAPVLLGEVYWFTFKRTRKVGASALYIVHGTWSITPQPR